MAWPYNKDWSGLNIQVLAEIIVALSVAVVERWEAIGSPDTLLLWPTFKGKNGTIRKQALTLADLDGTLIEDFALSNWARIEAWLEYTLTWMETGKPTSEADYYHLPYSHKVWFVTAQNGFTTWTWEDLQDAFPEAENQWITNSSIWLRLTNMLDALIYVAVAPWEAKISDAVCYLHSKQGLYADGDAAWADLANEDLEASTTPHSCGILNFLSQVQEECPGFYAVIRSAYVSGPTFDFSMFAGTITRQRVWVKVVAKNIKAERTFTLCGGGPSYYLQAGDTSTTFWWYYCTYVELTDHCAMSANSLGLGVNPFDGKGYHYFTLSTRAYYGPSVYLVPADTITFWLDLSSALTDQA